MEGLLANSFAHSSLKPPGSFAAPAALGGGAGIAAIIVGIAKAIAIIREQDRGGEIIFDDDGRPIKISGLTEAQIGTILEESLKQPEHNVVAFSTGNDRLIADLWDEKDEYYLPEMPAGFRIGDPPTKSHAHGGQVLAIVDSGIMAHHPWIRGRIKEQINFTGEGVGDLNGHGTLVALTALQAFGKLTKSLEGICLLDVKVLNKNATGTEKNLYAGLAWAAQHGADVVNNSCRVK